MKMEQKIDQIVEMLYEIKVDVARNTVDLAHHIKRSDKLEDKMQRMVYLLAIGAGIGLALYGPDVLKLIGIIL